MFMYRILSHRGFLHALLPWYNEHLVEQLGGEVARDCRAAAWPRGAVLPEGLSPAAIRGYVRAQSGEFIEGQVEEILARRRAKPALRPRIEASAVAQLAALVLHDFLTGELPLEERPMAA